MDITKYVVDNWDTLPKSSFDGDEIVIIKEISNEDYGFGHHNYEGLGVDKEGQGVWAYSSGCSCDGSCEINHIKDLKLFYIEIEKDNINPEEINFERLQVEFAGY